MPRVRWILYRGESWRLAHLATEHRIDARTLAHRLDRGLPIERALATGLVTREESGRRRRAQMRLAP